LSYSYVIVPHQFQIRTRNSGTLPRHIGISGVRGIEGQRGAGINPLADVSKSRAFLRVAADADGSSTRMKLWRINGGEDCWYGFTTL
jgi:hypothetical protein